MTIRRKIQLYENNDESVELTFTDPNSAPKNQPYPITGLTVNFYIKPNDQIADGDASVIKLSTTTDEITITDGAHGVAVVTISSTHLQTSGDLFWRADVLAGVSRKTGGYGTLEVIPL